MKPTFRCSSRCIIRCIQNYIVKRTSNAFIVFPFALSLILLIFNWPDFASIRTLKSIFKSILKYVPYTLSFAISLHLLGELFVTLLCSSKQIIDCTLKNVYTKHVSFIVLELHYMLALNHTSFPCFQIQPLSFWP